MKAKLLAILDTVRGTSAIFRSVFGASAALILVLFVFGIPHTAHADFLGWLAGKAADWTFGLLIEGIGLVVLSIANLLIYMVGALFNEVIIYTVFQFGDYFGNSAGLLAGWGVLRDVANIILIFGFVMLGVATILDIHGYEVKKTLPRLIIFAILLNFSLLASEAVIDTANAFAALLYNQASQTCTSGTQQQCASGGSSSGISGAVFQLSGIASTFSANTSNEGASPDHTHWGIAYIGMAIFVTILSVVLLAGVVMLVARGILLAFLMVLSPLGFAGLAVPPLEKYAHMWWDKLLSQAFFAPIYILLVLVGLKVAQGIAGQNVNLMNALAYGNVTAIGSVVIFAVIIGFLVAALMSAKQLGAIGAQFAIGMATSAVSYPFALVSRPVSWLGNKGAERVQNWVGRDKKKRSKWGNRTAAVLKFTGADQAIYGALKAPAKAKVGGHTSYDDYQKEKKQFADHSKHAAEAAELREALAAGRADLAEKIAQKMSLSTLKETITKCNDAQLQMLGEILSADTYDKLMNDKDVSPEAQHSLSRGRFGSFDYLKNVDIDTMPDDKRKDLQKRLRDLGTKDAELLAKYDSRLFSKIIASSNSEKESLFSDEQNEFVAKSNNVSREVRQLAKQNSKAGRVENWIGTAKHADAVALFENLTAEDKMKVKASTIADNSELLDTFNAPDVNAALVKSKFNKAQLAKMKTALLKKRGTPAGKELDAFFDKDTNLQSGLIGGWP
ncbi:MAG TPA: hypothetical protein VHC20_00455 [Candidatus Paceibacterota bacterium]|nr:hypothetical protein [Candidatus Paceibacterota bacterium]